jgi:hypothetical protein
MPAIKKEQLEHVKPPEEMVEVGLEELRRPDVIHHLGELAAAGLTALGQVTLFRNPDGKVCIANPVHVFFAPGALLEDDGEDLPPYRWVRPIMGSGRPQYAAWRDGELWEIEFEDGELPKTASY